MTGEPRTDKDICITVAVIAYIAIRYFNKGSTLVVLALVGIIVSDVIQQAISNLLLPYTSDRLIRLTQSYLEAVIFLVLYSLVLSTDLQKLLVFLNIADH